MWQMYTQVHFVDTSQSLLSSMGSSTCCPFLFLFFSLHKHAWSCFEKTISQKAWFFFGQTCYRLDLERTLRTITGSSSSISYRVYKYTITTKIKTKIIHIYAFSSHSHVIPQCRYRNWRKEKNIPTLSQQERKSKRPVLWRLLTEGCRVTSSKDGRGI